MLPILSLLFGGASPVTAPIISEFGDVQVSDSATATCLVSDSRVATCTVTNGRAATCTVSDEPG
jgi:hypothetical protein